MDDQNLRSLFRNLNRYFMVPAFRLGLGGLIVNPLSGYIMVLKTTGWKSGQVRYAPVNYAIFNGRVYCTTGFGAKTHWYRNLKAQPRLEMIMPGGVLQGVAEEVEEDYESLTIFRQILRNAGFAGFLEGYNPYNITDEELKTKMADTHILRIRPEGVIAGPGDPGGWLWILVALGTLCLMGRKCSCGCSGKCGCHKEK
jgi:deazaflavin-dependent oxidoreductase (nitroreductase family)